MRLYFTITGMNFYYGSTFMKPSMRVFLKKEAENEYDSEAISVSLPGLGKVGYVANSSHTVIGESYSAGRLYDKIGDIAEGMTLYVLPKGVLCYIDIKDPEETPDEKIIVTEEITETPPIEINGQPAFNIEESGRAYTEEELDRIFHDF